MREISVGDKTLVVVMCFTLHACHTLMAQFLPLFFTAKSLSVCLAWGGIGVGRV